MNASFDVLVGLIVAYISVLGLRCFTLIFSGCAIRELVLLSNSNSTYKKAKKNATMLKRFSRLCFWDAKTSRKRLLRFLIVLRILAIIMILLLLLLFLYPAEPDSRFAHVQFTAFLINYRFDLLSSVFLVLCSRYLEHLRTERHHRDIHLRRKQ